MHHHFTEDDLILFIYNELSETERLALQQAIECDHELKSKMVNLLEISDRLSTFSLDPDPTTIDMIMEHAHYEEHSH